MNHLYESWRVMLCVPVRLVFLLQSTTTFANFKTGSAYIDDPVAQNLLFDLLRRTERENGWPWAYVEQRILHTWQGGSR